MASAARCHGPGDGRVPGGRAHHRGAPGHSSTCWRASPRPVLAYGPQARWQSSKMGQPRTPTVSEVPTSPTPLTPTVLLGREASPPASASPWDPGHSGLALRAPITPGKRRHSPLLGSLRPPLCTEWLYPDTTGQVTPTPNPLSSGGYQAQGPGLLSGLLGQLQLPRQS